MGVDYPVRPIVRGVTASNEAYPAELVDNDCLPWFHFLDGLALVDTASPAVAGSQLFSTSWPLLGLTYNIPTGAGGYLGIYIATAAGTWTVQFPVDTRNDYPIVQYSVDGNNIGGTFDRYAAIANSAMHTITGVVLTRGLHEFRMTTTGKNASSSNYTLVYSGICLTRTA